MTRRVFHGGARAELGHTEKARQKILKIEMNNELIFFIRAKNQDQTVNEKSTLPNRIEPVWREELFYSQ